jgi:hypothetical protein
MSKHKEKGSPMTENPMTETPATESETAEDLLARIKRQTHERLEELSAAVEESGRLRAELKELEAQPEMLGEDLGIADADPQTAEADPGSEEGEPEPLSNVIRLPVAPGAPLDEVDEEVEPYERAS